MLFPLQEQMVGELRPALFALVGAVALVLLVACVNVANLLLARSAARERELGMRTALGARRGRLVRQMLTESLALAAAGGVGGLAVAALCHRGLLALVGDRIPVPRLDQLTLDLPVVAFTMVDRAGDRHPLWSGSGLRLDQPRERCAARRRTSRRRPPAAPRAQRRWSSPKSRCRSCCSPAPVCLMRSFLKLQSIDPGFRAEGVLTAGVQLPADAIRRSPRPSSFFRDSLARVAALPGVQHAAGAACLPVPFACIGTSFWRADRPKPADGQLSSGQVRPITPGFFKTLGIPQIAGRDFSDSDTVDSLPVAIVSEALVKAAVSDGEDPLGRRLRINVDHANGRDDVEWTIVGVVGNIKSSLDGPVRQTIYHPDDPASRPRHDASSCAPTQDPIVARHQRDGRRALDGAGSAGRGPHARGRSSAARSRGRARSRCWSACSRSLRSRSRRSASTA